MAYNVKITRKRDGYVTNSSFDNEEDARRTFENVRAWNMRHPEDVAEAVLMDGITPIDMISSA